MGESKGHTQKSLNRFAGRKEVESESILPEVLLQLYALSYPANDHSPLRSKGMSDPVPGTFNAAILLT